MTKKRVMMMTLFIPRLLPSPFPASSAYGLDSVSLPKRAARLKLALAAAARASESRRFDPAPRLVTADLLAISGDHEGAFDEYAEALFYLPYAGEVSAAVTSSAAQTAAGRGAPTRRVRARHETSA